MAPRETEGGNVYWEERVKTQKGRKDEGIRRYNDLCHQVAKESRENPNVLNEMVREWKASMHRTTTHQREAIATGTEAYHELWESPAV